MTSSQHSASKEKSLFSTWLVRTRELRLLGPFEEEQLKLMVARGELHPQDEIRRGDGYWIFLREADELKRMLGVELPQLLAQANGKIGDEKTEPEIQTKVIDSSGTQRGGQFAKEAEEKVNKALTGQNRFLDTLVSFPWLIGILFFFLAMMAGKMISIVRGPDF